jgi:two-component system chemotaxis response regulator CheB
MIPRILQFLKGSDHPPNHQLSTERKISQLVRSHASDRFDKASLRDFRPGVIVIASSTGGPNALEQIFQKIPPSFEIPILIAQHMPPIFTKILAKRLGDLCQKPSDEAVDGELIKPGRVYMAPGDFHLLLARSSEGIVIKLDRGPQRNSVRPAADYLFESAASLFGVACFGVVLTGMGQDGLHGARAIKAAGGKVMIQDEPSCVVFGMPGAIYKANCFDRIGDLDSIAGVIQSLSKNLH